MMHPPNKEQYRFYECERCGSVCLSNPVEENRLGTYYAETYLPYAGAKAWGKYASFVANSQLQLDKKRMQIVAKHLQMNAQTRVLDVGCGHPSFLHMLNQRYGAHCTGIDFSDHGWADLNDTGLHLFAVKTSDFQPSQQFDVITLWHYLEHDYHLPETASQLYKWLKPGGKIIIEVPNHRSVTATIQKQYWQGWHSPRHLTLFTASGFGHVFPSEKWRIVKHLKYGTLDAFTLWWLGFQEKRKINWGMSMQSHFWPLVALKVITFPIFLFEKIIPMGIQLIILEKK
jgi:SAM-dependent methyltransferase